jgi:hypothetical protein
VGYHGLNLRVYGDVGDEGGGFGASGFLDFLSDGVGGWADVVDTNGEAGESEAVGY